MSARSAHCLLFHPKEPAWTAFVSWVPKPLAEVEMPRYAVVMTDRRPYPSDLSDAPAGLVEPTLVSWRRARTERALAFGRPPEHELRDLLDAILYVDRTGIAWRYLPHDYPPWETVYAYFALAEGGSIRAAQRPSAAAGPCRRRP
jgi:transposase